MCKSANQPGGPYRCSGDMQRRLAAAEDAYEQVGLVYQQAREDEAAASRTMIGHSMTMERRVESPDAVYVRNGTSGTAAQHITSMIRSGDLSPAAREMKPSEVFDQFREANALDADDAEVPQFDGSGDPAYVAANQGWTLANRKHNAAMAERQAHGQNSRAALDAMAAARADYDATPRGLGELQRDIDLARAGGGEDPVLRRRFTTATATIESEVEQRLANDSARGEEPRRFTYQPLATTPMSTNPGGADRLAVEDQVTGCAKVYAPPPGSPTAQAKVTLTRRASDGQAVEATFATTVNTNDPTPLSTGSVLRGLSERARQVDAANNDFETWRERQRHPSRSESPEGHRAARETFDAIQRDSMRLGQFVGASRFFSYVTRG